MKKLFLYISIFILLIIANTDTYARESTYHIGPGDVLEISVWKDESLSREVVVPPDGFLSFPLIGSIDVMNSTIPDLRKIIKKKLSEYVPDATLTVLLKRNESLKAYVIGKVNNPGDFFINMDTRVMQILSMAGGLNAFASEGNILILRLKDNKTIKIPFNYNQVEKGKNLEQNILLKRGDVVVVP